METHHEHNYRRKVCMQNLYVINYKYVDGVKLLRLHLINLKQGESVLVEIMRIMDQ